MGKFFSNNAVFPFEYCKDQIFKNIWSYSSVYLTDIKASTCIYERNYIDKDYLIDYSKYYSRSYNNWDRTTERFHFFTNEFDEKTFSDAIEINDKRFFEELQSSYLGYIVVKPITNETGRKVIGKTVLATYPKTDGGDNRNYIVDNYSISLFGIELSVNSIPFQMQDVAISRCATISCWISLFPLVKLFGIQLLSPYEITERSSIFPTECRNFPSEGLTLQQMQHYFNSIGLETEFIDPADYALNEDFIEDTDDIVADTTKAYSMFGLPIIAGLELYKKDDLPGDEEFKSGMHAVVITGYRTNKNGTVKELYIHDDNIGPYSRVHPIDGHFFCWNNALLKEDYSKVKVKKLIIPVYSKIRLNFSRIYPAYLRYKRTMDEKISKGTASSDSSVELFLTDVRKYKSFLLEQTFEEKPKILKECFPRFLWIIRIKCEDTPHYDYIFDGTGIYAKIFRDIEFMHAN